MERKIKQLKRQKFLRVCTFINFQKPTRCQKSVRILNNQPRQTSFTKQTNRQKTLYYPQEAQTPPLNPIDRH